MTAYHERYETPILEVVGDHLKRIIGTTVGCWRIGVIGNKNYLEFNVRNVSSTIER